MFYVIIRQCKKTYLERFSEQKWEIIKYQLGEDSIETVTTDINDERLKKCDEIIWMRHFSDKTSSFQTIEVPFTPNDVELMKMAAHKKLIAIIKKENRKKISSQEDLYSGEMSEYELIMKWRNSGYKNPPDARIEQIRKKYNVTFDELIDMIENV